MKKIVDGLILIVLCIFLFTGCSQSQQIEETKEINFEEIANAEKIEITHYFNGTVTTKTTENTDTINQIANWMNELLLNEVSFPENETPADTEESEKYSFVIYDLEGNQKFDIDYIINEDSYILCHEKWYRVSNTVSITFIENI